jgi:ubiquinone/menaquinone biosynthesis C-methylase UbiE
MEHNLKKNTDLLNKITGLNFIDSFLNYSDTYSDNRYFHMIKAMVCKKFINKYSSLQKTFLDAGAGRGPYTEIAKEKYGKRYCFEYNQTELNNAKINLKYDDSIIFNQVDITKIPLDNNTIDVAICSEVLEHISMYNTAMDEIYRVMKKDAVLLFSMPNNNSLLYGPSKIKNKKLLINLDNTKIKDKKWEQLRHYMFNYKQIENIANNAGFKIIEKQGVNNIRLPKKLRKFLMIYLPSTFEFFIKVDTKLGKIIPNYGSFYFLTLQK